MKNSVLAGSDDVRASATEQAAILGTKTAREKRLSGELFNAQVSNAELPTVNTTPALADGRSQSILPGVPASTKQVGLEAFAAGDYTAAQLGFSDALKNNRNDPESLIYLNNAKIGDGSAYVIAVSVPMGEVVDPSLEIIRGVAHVQSKVNAAGGINGTLLKVLLFDDQGSEETAKTIAAELVADSSVLGVVGHYASDTSLAAAEIYEEGGLTMISPISTAVKYTNAGDYIFRTVPSNLVAAKTLAIHTLKDPEKNNAAIFYTSRSAYSQSMRTEFSTAFLNKGGDVSHEFDVSDPNFDAQTAVSEAKAEGANVIMLALTIDTSDSSLDIIVANQRSLPLIGGDDLYDSKILREGRDNVLGMAVAVPWHLQNYLQSEFVKDSQRLWGGDVNWRTVTAYDATMALVAGIMANPTRVGIAETLAQPGFSVDGATTAVKFSRSGDRNQPSQIVEVVAGDRSGQGYDYAPVK